MAAVTSYQDATFSVSAIGGRTDSNGDPVTDFSAEEARFLAELLTEGYLKPTDAFKVQPAAVPDMTVVVGSGTAKADFYVVAGDTGGQGQYVVRLDDASQVVTVPGADASLARTDEVYLVVADDTYDAGGLSLPRIGYRKGDAGGSAPGPDTSWEAYVLLATISVPALETAIEAANITDERAAATLAVGADTNDLVTKDLIDAKGDLLVGTAADTVARLAVGTNDQVLTADSSQAAGVKWADAASSGFSDIDVQVFTASGTWNKPAGAVKVQAQVVGGGAGGNGNSGSTAGSGGGGGGYALGVFDAASLGSSESVTVGSGGTGGEGGGGAAATAGGDSTFSTLTGGGGTTNMAGGVGSGGILNSSGFFGTNSFKDGSDDTGGNGGGSFFGGGGIGGITNGQDAVGYGAGGGGGGNLATPNAGGNGQAGVVVVTTYLSA